jgi:nascent polypeptide-associated complex subunit alpha
MSTDEVKIEEVADEEVDTVEESVKEDVAEAAEEQAGPSRAKQNRAEKKCRRALQKVGLRPVKGINRVTAKCATNLFVIAKPDVYRVPNTETYIVFGEPKIEDMNANAAQKAAEQFKNTDEVLNAAKDIEGMNVADDIPALESTTASPADDGEIDASGLEESDITIIQSQTSCTRAVAVKALKDTSGDLVAAILVG